MSDTKHTALSILLSLQREKENIERVQSSIPLVGEDCDWSTYRRLDYDLYQLERKMEKLFELL